MLLCIELNPSKQRQRNFVDVGGTTACTSTTTGWFNTHHDIITNIFIGFVFEWLKLSYQWGNQPIVLKIALSLKEAGYKVWLDVEQMYGSTLEASMFSFRSLASIFFSLKNHKNLHNISVARAVELVMCSHLYEWEVQRFTQLQDIPLMMQKGYIPTGWYFNCRPSIKYINYTNH